MSKQSLILWLCCHYFTTARFRKLGAPSLIIQVWHCADAFRGMKGTQILLSSGLHSGREDKVDTWILSRQDRVLRSLGEIDLFGRGKCKIIHNIFTAELGTVSRILRSRDCSRRLRQGIIRIKAQRGPVQSDWTVVLSQGWFWPPGDMLGEGLLLATGDNSERSLKEYFDPISESSWMLV